MEIGQLVITITLMLSVYSAAAYIAGIITKNERFIKSGQMAVYLIAALTTIASALLLMAFINRDFQVLYVAMYSSSDLPFFYTVSAFWAGGEGSLLLWIWLISIFAAVLIYREPRDDLLKHSMVVLMAILSYFLYLLVFLSNPFNRLDFVPPDGQGLNPLLQDPGMVFHPPTLFIGYAGFFIPFAFAIAGLYLGNGDWVYRIRRWTLFSWLFLSFGNILGSYWAYTMLNWGGYWGWDPVENASFMPWLTATAFFHSFMIQERKDGLKIWNFLLIIFTFELVLLGTLLTRSGIISSVHSFGQSEIGPYFIGLMAVVLIGSLGLLVWKYDTLNSRKIYESPISREVSFIANNWIFIGATFAVIWGTLYPIVSEVFRGYKVMVGPQFFNEITIPFGLALIILMGICPLIGWRKASILNLKRSYTYPFAISIVLTFGSWLLGISNVYVLILVFGSVFAAGTHILDTVRNIKHQQKTHEEELLASIHHTIWDNRRTYGGYIAHLGVVLLVLGIGASSVYSHTESITMRTGGSYTVGDYTYVMTGLGQKQLENKVENIVLLDAYKDGKLIERISPSQFYYPKQDQEVVKPWVWGRPLGDVHFTVQGISTGTATMKIKSLPLMNVLWYGALVVTLGTLIAMTARAKIRRKRELTL
ncbi:MAG: heme lyase CcmF/NrfE family subunit [ANME-2 cluster archaeon]|nr:MAG: heme lyase CcmF/NrfE family subunit [ANME-2 cluster archaeon]